MPSVRANHATGVRGLYFVSTVRGSRNRMEEPAAFLPFCLFGWCDSSSDTSSDFPTIPFLALPLIDDDSGKKRSNLWISETPHLPITVIRFLNPSLSIDFAPSRLLFQSDPFVPTTHSSLDR